MAKKKKFKITLDNDLVILPLNVSMGGIRIADKFGNHVEKPTKKRNEEIFFIEWMITNDEIKLLVDKFFDNTDINSLIETMNNISKFAEESSYSNRETIKVDKAKVDDYEGFAIYQYTENFSSFEKVLSSEIKVRITFKLGDYGLKPHPHMYVLLPFQHTNVEIWNKDGKVNPNSLLGSGCHAKWSLVKSDLKEIILALAHSSKNHRSDLITKITS